MKGCLMNSAGGWLGRAALGDGTNFNADIRAFVSLGAPHSPPPEVGAGGRVQRVAEGALLLLGAFGRSCVDGYVRECI